MSKSLVGKNTQMRFPVHTPTWIVGLVLLAGVLLSACAGRGAEQVELEPPPVPVSTEAAERFFSKALAAGQQALMDQSVHLTVTDEEVTSALALAARFVAFSPSGVSIDREMVPEGDQLPSDIGLPEGLQEVLPLDPDGDGSGLLGGFTDSLRLKILDPQVRFTAQGQIDIRATGQLGERERPVHLVLAPRASQGELELDFVEGSLGGLPIPELIFDPIGNLMARLILAGQDYIRVNEITVVQGSLTLSGEWTGESPLE